MKINLERRIVSAAQRGQERRLDPIKLPRKFLPYARTHEVLEDFVAVNAVADHLLGVLPLGSVFWLGDSQHGRYNSSRGHHGTILLKVETVFSSLSTGQVSLGGLDVKDIIEVSG